MKIKSKLTIFFLLVVFIPLFFVSLISYSSAQQAITTETLNHLDSIASIQKDRIQRTLVTDAARIDQLSTRQQYRTELQKYNKENNKESQEILIKNLKGVKAKISDYKDLYLLDPDGMVVASTDSSEIGKIHSNDEFFLRGKKGTDVTIIFKENNELRSWLVSPITADNNELIGIVAAKTEPIELLHISGAYIGLGQTGETAIAMLDSGDALWIAPLRFDPDAALKRRISMQQTDIPMVQALSKIEGTFADAVDYKGNKIFAASRYIEGPGWGLVVKINQDEALAPIKKVRYFTSIMTLFSLLIVSIIGLIISNSISKPIIKLKEAADDISKGRTDVEIDPALMKAKDEIGDLARAYDRTLISLKMSMQEKKEDNKELKI